MKNFVRRNILTGKILGFNRQPRQGFAAFGKHCWAAWNRAKIAYPNAHNTGFTKNIMLNNSNEPLSQSGAYRKTQKGETEGGRILRKIYYFREILNKKSQKGGDEGPLTPSPSYAIQV